MTVSVLRFSNKLACALQGKAEPWEKAQDLTRQAEESARTAQIKVCDAQKTYENYTRATEAAEAAHSRQAQVRLACMALVAYAVTLLEHVLLCLKDTTRTLV